MDTITPDKPRIVNENQVTVGVDMGLRNLLTLSDGTIYENPNALRKNEKALKRIQRILCKRQIGGKNRDKQRTKLAIKRYKVYCIRQNAIHQATASIIKNYDRIIIETLLPANMVKNKKVSKSISDAPFGEIARQLTYKALWNGNTLVKADLWFASSKICSNCGNKKAKLGLWERTYKCAECHVELDRDLNAAKNLASYSPTSEFEGREACGAPNPSLATKNRGAKKQEVRKNKLAPNEPSYLNL